MRTQTVVLSYLENENPIVFDVPNEAMEKLNVDTPVNEMTVIRNVLQSSEAAGDLYQEFTSNDDGTEVTITRQWSDDGWNTYSTLDNQIAVAKSHCESIGWNITLNVSVEEI